jgi:mono/diheme cytochrome c family protein
MTPVGGIEMRVWTSAVLLLTASAAVASPPNITRGRRIAQIEGCISCHGEKLDGHLVEDNPQFALAWSSNLSRLIPRWNNAIVEHVLRTGRRPDGSALWFMPTYVHSRLSGADMRDLIAWMRTVPPTGVNHPPLKRGPQFAAALKQGFQDSAAQAARLAPRAAIDLGPRYARGRYLAQIACSECHGPALKGVPNPTAGDPPDLAVAAAYDAAQFRTLLRTGRGMGGRDLGDMTKYGAERFVGLSDQDRSEIYRYLVARARAAGR